MYLKIYIYDGLGHSSICTCPNCGVESLETAISPDMTYTMHIIILRPELI